MYDNRLRLVAVLRALDLKAGGRGVVVGPGQQRRSVIDRSRGQFLRGRKRQLADNTRSIDALRSVRAVKVVGARGRSRIASGKSEKQHQRNEDRRNTENEDDPVHWKTAQPMGVQTVANWPRQRQG